MKKSKTIGIIALIMMSVLVFASCDKNGYEPIQTSTDACQIIVQCIDGSGNNLLDNKKFVDGISIEGNASHSKIKYDVRNASGGKSLFFTAELPDQDDMRWSKDRKEANGISKMTMKFNKHKVELKCHIKYIANRPPAVSGGKATLEEVSCNNQTFKRSGSSVTITLRMDKNGKLI